MQADSTCLVIVSGVMVCMCLATVSRKASVAATVSFSLERTGPNFSSTTARILVEVNDLMFSNKSRFDSEFARFSSARVADMALLVA